MINQSIQLRQQQKLSPMQIQLVKLLEIPSVSLEQRIKEELESNPVLEADERPLSDDDPAQQLRDRDEHPDEGGFDENLLNEDIPYYKLKANNYSDDDEKRERVPYSEAATFYEHLEEQIGQHDFTDRQAKIARYVIGNIDEDGYLRRTAREMTDDICFGTGLEVAEDEVGEVLAVVHTFDPPGVAALDLRECLLLQLKPDDSVERSILQECFEDFAKRHYGKIAKRLHLDDDELREAIDNIQHLNPKPGSAYGGGIVRQAQHITPDFILDYDANGEIGFHLNRMGERELHISPAYQDMLRELQRNRSNLSKDQINATDFVRAKIKSAQWFIDALKQRNTTLTRVMQAILDYQHDYLVDGDETKLRPMILKDIAERTNLDVSTISRVSSSKYAQTSFGIVPLKSFFTERLENMEGEEVSSQEVKSHIRDVVASEDKTCPINDETIVEQLRDKGYKLARRTVAKYRDQLGIPVARLRKKI